MDGRRSGRSTLNTILLALILALALGGCVLFYGLLQQMQALGRAASGPGEAYNNLQTQVAQFQHPTPTIRPSPATIVTKIQALSRLESVAYSVEKVISAEENQGPFGWLVGDRLLFVAHGNVVAGVDLGKMQASDILVTPDNRVVVTLPAAEIFSVYLDNQKSYVYQRDTGVLRGAGNINLEASARQAAENEILSAAMQDGILKLAQNNAQNVVRGLLLQLGFSDVQFIVATPTPSTPIPPTLVP